MPPVLPFAGLRYAAPAASSTALVCPPYDVISAEEQAQLLRAVAHNAVRLELPADEPGQPGSRYRVRGPHAGRLARSRRARARRRARPTTCPRRTFTYARHRAAAPRRAGRASRVEPWSARVALPHEHTMAAPKADRLELLRATHLNASPDLAAVTRAATPSSSRPGRTPKRARRPSSSPGAASSTACGWSTTRRRRRARSRLRGRRAAVHRRRPPSLRDQPGLQARAPASTCPAPAQRWRPSPGPTTRACSRCPPIACCSGLDPALTLEEAETRWARGLPRRVLPRLGRRARRTDRRPHPAAGQQRSRRRRASACTGWASPTCSASSSCAAASRPMAPCRAERSDAWKSLDVSLLHTLLVDPLIAETGRPRDGRAELHARSARGRRGASVPGTRRGRLLLESHARQQACWPSPTRTTACPKSRPTSTPSRPPAWSCATWTRPHERASSASC